LDRATFLANALGHTKFFLFAGHDTTASAICWTIHYLSLHPGALAKLRAELDSVLGFDAASALRARPHLVNSLTYSGAVLKESLRLQPNVGTFRMGGSDFTMYGPPDCEFAGRAFPTDHCRLWDGNWAMHKNADLWHRVDEFVPERWLVTDETDPLYPPRNAFRAFELGPRDCIGQFLAQVEMKLVLALTARDFDFAEDWERWDIIRCVPSRDFLAFEFDTECRVYHALDHANWISVAGKEVRSQIPYLARGPTRFMRLAVRVRLTSRMGYR
jgi:cytochrome P450